MPRHVLPDPTDPNRSLVQVDGGDLISVDNALLADPVQGNLAAEFAAPPAPEPSLEELALLLETEYPAEEPQPQYAQLRDPTVRLERNRMLPPPTHADTQRVLTIRDQQDMEAAAGRIRERGHEPGPLGPSTMDVEIPEPGAGDTPAPGQAPPPSGTTVVGAGGVQGIEPVTAAFGHRLVGEIIDRLRGQGGRVSEEDLADLQALRQQMKDDAIAADEAGKDVYASMREEANIDTGVQDAVASAIEQANREEEALVAAQQAEEAQLAARLDAEIAEFDTALDELSGDQVSVAQIFSGPGGRSAFSAAMAVAGGAMASVARQLTFGQPSENVALSIINSAIDRELRSQEINLNSRYRVQADMRQNLLGTLRTRFQDTQASNFGARAVMMERAARAMRAQAMRAGSPAARQRIETVIAQLQHQAAMLRAAASEAGAAAFEQRLRRQAGRRLPSLSELTALLGQLPELRQALGGAAPEGGPGIAYSRGITFGFRWQDDATRDRDIAAFPQIFSDEEGMREIRQTLDNARSAFHTTMAGLDYLDQLGDVSRAMPQAFHNATAQAATITSVTGTALLSGAMNQQALSDPEYRRSVEQIVGEPNSLIGGGVARSRRQALREWYRRVINRYAAQYGQVMDDSTPTFSTFRRAE